MKINRLLIISSIFLWASCYTGQNISEPDNTSLVYKQSNRVLHPQFKIFHETPDDSKIYLKLYTNELRFSTTNPERINQAVLNINYYIKSSIESNEIIDSSKQVLKVEKTENQTSIISFFRLKPVESESFIVEFHINDVYGNKKSKNYLTINRSNDGNAQYYISFFANYQKPVFTEYFSPIDTLLIKTCCSKRGKFSISKYKLIEEPAIKPFKSNFINELNLLIDSSIYLKPYPSDSLFFSKTHGIYIIRSDSSKLKGFMKVQFKNAFPLISKPDELNDAISYLLTDEEYTYIKNSNNKKFLVDKFWLTTNENKERSKELIKIWYNRAVYSNYFFTSYKEGYKTDRGMIYIVFGPPDNIEYINGAEKWLYYNSENNSELDFLFTKQEQSVSENDYTLLRESRYEPYWNKAVKTWRSGKVYRF